MILSTRVRFLATLSLTVLGIMLIAAYAWRSFSEVSTELGMVSARLLRITTIEQIEAELHERGAKSATANDATLNRLLASLRAHADDADDALLVTTLEERVARARANGGSEAWAEAAEVVSQIVKGELAHMAGDVERTGDPARAGARVTLQLGALMVCVVAVLALFIFLRHRRESRHARERLRRSDRLAALGTMAASVAHEINNPLATISGCASAVKDRLLRDAAQHTDSIEYLGMIEGETTRCSGIVRQLHDLSRDAPPAMSPTDLSDLARDVVGFVSMNRAGPRARVETETEPGLIAVCDADKVKQLLLNLLVNARDAAGEGGVVRLQVTRDGGSARIAVEDNGVGIGKDELARVFEPFHTTKTRGLGLGLFLCERIATMHGGTIRAESEGRGRGARIVVSLPTHMEPDKA